MQLPVQVTFRNIEASEAIEAAVRDKADKLNQFFPGIMSCRVVVDARHKQHHQGNIYDVHIDIKVPGKELAISREKGLNHAHEDVYVAIRDAFDAARRKLQDHSAQIQKQIKTHETIPHGKILFINPDQDFGLIETPDGREIYFHRNSILNANLEDLTVGDPVRFHEENGEEGPQASSVYMEGKHHAVGV